MSSPEFDFEAAFGNMSDLPSEYDSFPDPKSLPTEERVTMTIAVMRAHQQILKTSSTSEEVEKTDIQLDTFLRWMKPTDEELEKALDAVFGTLGTAPEFQKDTSSDLDLDGFHSDLWERLRERVEESKKDEEK